MITDRINVDAITEIFAYDSSFIKYRQKKEFNFFTAERFDTTWPIVWKLSSNQFYSLQYDSSYKKNYCTTHKLCLQKINLEKLEVLQLRIPSSTARGQN